MYVHDILGVVTVYVKLLIHVAVQVWVASLQLLDNRPDDQNCPLGIVPYTTACEVASHELFKHLYDSRHGKDQVPAGWVGG